MCVSCKYFNQITVKDLIFSLVINDINPSPSIEEPVQFWGLYYEQ